MARYYSSGRLAARFDVSRTTAWRCWKRFPQSVDELGRAYVEVPDDAQLLRYGPRKHPKLRVLNGDDAQTDDADALDEATAPYVVAALLQEMAARTRQIDRLIALLEKERGGAVPEPD